MLERHEQEALDRIEAQLRDDDPHLSASLESGVPLYRVHPIVRSVLVLVAALVLTTVVTLALGPNLGGLVAVLTLSYAFLHAWQALRVCRGTGPR